MLWVFIEQIHFDKTYEIEYTNGVYECGRKKQEERPDLKIMKTKGTSVYRYLGSILSEEGV